MRGAIAIVVLAAALVGAPATQAASTGRIAWPNQVPPGSPFEPSRDFSGITFPGPYFNYETSDTYYPSWGADDKLYSPFMDGGCGPFGSFGGSPGDERIGGPVSDVAPTSTVMGTAVISGDDPSALTLDCGVIQDEHQGWDGRYASASLHHDGVWYYGSYLLNRYGHADVEDCGNYCTLGPFVGWHVSTDNGETWQKGPHTAQSPLFGESIEGDRRVKLGALHVVDFGKNMEHSPDGYAYLVGHGGGGPGSQNTWVNGDHVYMVRVKPSPKTINDRSAYEYYAGTEGGRPRFSKRFEDIQPLLSWPGHLGSAAITYDAPLRKYLLFMSRPSDGVDTTAPFDTIVMEADSLTGPYRMVHWLPKFGSQAYFVNAPSRFISRDGRTMWLSYSGNYNNASGESNPPGSTYSFVLRQFTLDVRPGRAVGRRRCRGTRRVRMRVPRLRRGERVLRVRAHTLGRRQKARRAGVRAVRLTVPASKGRRVRIRIAVRTTSGRLIKLTRSFRACAPGRRA